MKTGRRMTGKKEMKKPLRKNRHSLANAIFSAPKEIVRACLRNWTTKQQHLSFLRFRTMYSLRSKTAEISDSWRSSRKKSGSTHGC